MPRRNYSRRTNYAASNNVTSRVAPPPKPPTSVSQPGSERPGLLANAASVAAGVAAGNVAGNIASNALLGSGGRAPCVSGVEQTDNVQSLLILYIHR